MLSRLFVLLSVAMTASSFNTLNTNSFGLHTGNRTTKHRAPKRKINDKTVQGETIDAFGNTCTNALATVLICGTLLASPDPSAAQVLTPEFSRQPIRMEEPIEKSSAPVFTTSGFGDSCWTLSDNFDAKNFPRERSLAESLKERALEKAKELQEKQQAAAAERDARNKAFDDLFDQAEKERNEYYSKKIISRETYLQNLREQEANQDSGPFNPQASPTQELKERLEQNLREENKLRIALIENRQKDQDNKETKVERTLLKIALEKSENETAKLRKDISLAESIETIKMQRQAEIRIYQERAESREKEKQEAMESIRKIKEREAVAFEELRARKRQEVDDLKFASSQSTFERKLNDIERFDQRKSVLDSKRTEESTVNPESESNLSMKSGGASSEESIRGQ